ncbi:amidohydrolase family protein [Mesorhizobium sp. M1328]|uniref:amidohydrolase family protein n=1 Tax=Mesorhizobium sp. M1328 TaxID=2957082 RepID=UPI00333B09C2
MGTFRRQDGATPEAALALDAAGPVLTVLAGRVVTLDAGSTIHSAGYVCIRGNTIAAVVDDKTGIPAEFAAVTPVDTKGTIYPGLIELHNHLGYNMLPLWEVPQRYSNRNIWRNDFARYLPEVSWPATVLGKNTDLDYQRAIVRYVECRSLFGGVTTAQGLSGNGEFYKGLVRNVEAPLDAAWPKAEGQTLDYRADEIETALLPKLQQPRPFFYHLSEGTDDDALQRFLDLDCGAKGWAINGNLIPIHCVALRPEHLQRLTAAAGMVWSPLSNFLLYGQTADVATAKKLGIPIALGSDWGPSGSKNLLGELKVARIVSDEHARLFSDEDLVRMITTTPAKMLGWDGYLGSIETGKRADLLVLADTVEHPYSQLVNAHENQILVIVIDGRPRIGRQGLLEFVPDQQETVRIGGWRYALDLAEDSGQTLGGLTLASAIAKLTYGLQHLPELAREYVRQTAFLVARSDEKALFTETLDLDHWGLDLEFEPQLTTLRAAMEKAPEIDPTLIKRLELPPLTEIDDASFRHRLRANVNLPEFVRRGL